MQNFRHHVTRFVAILFILGVIVGLATAQEEDAAPRFPENVRAAGLVTELGLSQTVGDVTVTLDWAYADTQQLAVGYTVTGVLPDILLTPFSPTPYLRTADGSMFSIQTSYPVPGSESGPVQMVLLYYAQALRTDASGIMTVDNDYFANAFDTLPETIDLQLEMTLGGFTFPENIPMSPDSALTPGADIPLVGPFVFDFAAALYAPVEAEPQQTVTASDISMTVQQVTLTPSQVEVRLCYDMPSAQDWLPHPELTVNGAPTLPTGMGIVTTKGNPAESNQSPYRCRLMQFDAAYDGQPTTLVLSVDFLTTSMMEGPDEWLQIKDILAQEGIDIDVNFSQGAGGGGLAIDIISLPDGADFDEAVNRARVQMGNTILGPWEFTIAIP